MSYFFKQNRLKSYPVRSHKPSYCQSQLTRDDSIIDNFSDSFMGADHSIVLKQNQNSLNSTNNITFGYETEKIIQKRTQNLAYSICSKFPPKIKKQVEAIIDYYENQLQGQRQMFWRATQKSKTQKYQAVILAKFQKQNIQQSESSLKNKRINELENKLLLKDKKINDLTKEITQLMIKCTKLSKQLNSSNNSLHSSRLSIDSINLRQ